MNKCLGILLLMLAHGMMAAQPSCHVLLTYHALDYILCGKIKTVDHVFARGEERIYGDAPPKEKLAKFKDADYYVTTGAPVETKIEKTLLELNPRIKVLVATNGCHLIEHNHYLWYSVCNIDIMRTNCRDVFAPDLFRCGTMLNPNLFKTEKMTVGVTHDAFEYWCRFNGIRYSRIPEEFDEAELKARNIRIIYKARRGIGVCVRQTSTSGIVIVEADPFVSCHDLHSDLLDPYLVELKKFRDEEVEKENPPAAQQSAANDGSANLRSALRVPQRVVRRVVRRS